MSGSQPLPVDAAVVDQLFQRLAVAYGHRFMSLWDGLSLVDVKADWVLVLGGLNANQVDFGLQNLPAGRPPDAREFRLVCLRMPEPARRFALPAPPRAVPQRFRTAIVQLGMPLEDDRPERVRNAARYIALWGSPGKKLNPQQQADLKVFRQILEFWEADEAVRKAKTKAQEVTS